MIPCAIAVAMLGIPAGQGLVKDITVAVDTVTKAQPGKAADFFVRFKNNSNKKVNLLQEGCSWGYMMVSFEWKDSSGSLHEITRAPKSWRRNYPFPAPIEPGHELLRAISLRDGSWTGLPSGVPGKPTQINLRAMLKIEPDSWLKGRGIWVGHAESPWHTVVLGAKRSPSQQPAMP